ncbi:MAG: methyl-accepting chemotaxis protein [Candidatus Omnitrophica bacterium]|nr:methyl-accepting chemotaxis protein [Candidatus Omnitrophota bacterium]MBU4488653.1 methyl-accepting chemotaxis protein [Candidatus Omnitrophota bacterium]MCG2704449.1 methyl-accepting chemotaxis protein [Candidatus Omnitrophota bacterium]
MKPKIHARRKYLINKEIQLSYSWLLIVCVGLVILVFGLSLWYINKVHLDLFHQIVGEDALPKAYIDSIQNQFLIGIPITIVLVSLLLFGLGIYSSHKVAGPMYRIAKNMNLIGVENHIDTVQIRKRDQLRGLADAFNHMVHALKDRMYQDMRLIDQVRMKIAQLHTGLKGESVDIDKLSEQVKEIDKLAIEMKNRKQEE